MPACGVASAAIAPRGGVHAIGAVAPVLPDGAVLRRVGDDLCCCHVNGSVRDRSMPQGDGGRERIVRTPWSDWRPGVGTSWGACPLSRAWHGAVTRGDNRARQCADRAAHEWNRVIYRGPLAWLRRAPRPPVRFSADD